MSIILGYKRGGGEVVHQKQFLMKRGVIIFDRSCPAVIIPSGLQNSLQGPTGYRVRLQQSTVAGGFGVRLAGARLAGSPRQALQLLYNPISAL